MGKHYDLEFKARVLKEAQETGNKAAVARKYGLNKCMVRQWELSSEGKIMTHSNSQEKNENRRLTQENEQLKKLLGEKDLEIAILQDLVKKTNQRKVIEEMLRKNG